jgi:hypothetical protein
MKFDSLGVTHALLQFEADLNRSLLPEPKRLLPKLKQIAGDPKCVWTSPAIKASLASLAS